LIRRVEKWPLDGIVNGLKRERWFFEKKRPN